MIFKKPTVEDENLQAMFMGAGYEMPWRVRLGQVTGDIVTFPQLLLGYFKSWHFLLTFMWINFTNKRGMMNLHLLTAWVTLTTSLMIIFVSLLPHALVSMLTPRYSYAFNTLRCSYLMCLNDLGMDVEPYVAAIHRFSHETLEEESDAA